MSVDTVKPQYIFRSDNVDTPVRGNQAVGSISETCDKN